jgi:hypothetical protein
MKISPFPEASVKTSHRIPLLKDHHTHPYLYAALAHCPDISSVKLKDEGPVPDQ